ncbi:MAG: hypothetical protein JXB48_20850 [Candidatus Latescibacteria bacterium]|nr:hypothetical protein [Candidatus Latescibacterota bacterium]
MAKPIGFFFSSMVLFLVFLILSCTNPNSEENVAGEQYKVHLVGKLLTNVAGRKLENIIERTFSRGSHELSWSRRGSNSGCCIVQVQIGKRSYAQYFHRFY